MAGSLLDLVTDRTELLRALTSATPGTPRWTPLGIPIINPDGSSDHAVGQLMEPPVRRIAIGRASLRSWLVTAGRHLTTRYRRDSEIMTALGASKRRTAPWTQLKPGDYAQLRALLVAAQANSATDLVRASDDDPARALRALEAAGTGLQVVDAVPFFIPSAIATALMTSEAPDEQLIRNVRLPFPSVFVFFDAIPLGELELDSVLRDASSDNIIDNPSLSLIGVILYSGPNGVGLDQIIHWIMTAPLRDTHGVTIHPGFWRKSAQPGVVANIASLCTWARWHPPAPTPTQLEGPEDTRPWRRSLNKSAVRKALARGAILGVNVVDLAALHNNHSDDTSTQGGRQIRAHWRRGYWNRVRVATRAPDGAIIGDRLGQPDIDWHYEGRWIHPVLVGGVSHDTDTITVYRINRQP